MKSVGLWWAEHDDAYRILVVRYLGKVRRGMSMVVKWIVREKIVRSLSSGGIWRAHACAYTVIPIFFEEGDRSC
jgi:hypothetical protein